MQRTRLINRSFFFLSPTLSEEEDGFPGVHARERHDVQVRQPSLVRVGDGQQVLQVSDLGIDLVPSSLGCAFGRAVHGVLLLRRTVREETERISPDGSFESCASSERRWNKVVFSVSVRDSRWRWCGSSQVRCWTFMSDD